MSKWLNIQQKGYVNSIICINTYLEKLREVWDIGANAVGSSLSDVDLKTKLMMDHEQHQVLPLVLVRKKHVVDECQVGNHNPTNP
jgi:hypothetical protein